MNNFSPAFLAQIPKTLAFEGGYVNDPQDPGGETNFGISKSAFPSLNIHSLTVADATQIYWDYYWVAALLPSLDQSVAVGKLFDMGVNMGPNRAFRILQAELNRYRWSALVVDGKLGPKTIKAFNVVPDPNTLVYWLRLGSEAFYNELAAEHPVMRKYLRGWLRRAAA